MYSIRNIPASLPITKSYTRTSIADFNKKRPSLDGGQYSGGGDHAALPRLPEFATNLTNASIQCILRSEGYVFQNSHSNNDKDSMLEVLCRSFLLESLGGSINDHHLVWTMNATHAITTLLNHYTWGMANGGRPLISVDIDAHASLSIPSKQIAKAHKGWAFLSTTKDVQDSVLGSANFTGVVRLNKDTTWNDIRKGILAYMGNVQVPEVEELQSLAVAPLCVIPSHSNLDASQMDHESFRDFRNQMKENGTRWRTLLDAAKSWGDRKFDLTLFDKYEYEYSVFSVYKMYGAPTGLGGLVVKKEGGNFELRPSTEYPEANTDGVYPCYGGGSTKYWDPNGMTVEPSNDLTMALTCGSAPIHSILYFCTLMLHAEHGIDRPITSSKEFASLLKNSKRPVEFIDDVHKKSALIGRYLIESLKSINIGSTPFVTFLNVPGVGIGLSNTRCIKNSSFLLAFKDESGNEINESDFVSAMDPSLPQRPCWRLGSCCNNGGYYLRTIGLVPDNVVGQCSVSSTSKSSMRKPCVMRVTFGPCNTMADVNLIRDRIEGVANTLYERQRKGTVQSTMAYPVAGLSGIEVETLSNYNEYTISSPMKNQYIVEDIATYKGAKYVYLLKQAIDSDSDVTQCSDDEQRSQSFYLLPLTGPGIILEGTSGNGSKDCLDDYKEVYKGSSIAFSGVRDTFSVVTSTMLASLHPDEEETTLLHLAKTRYRTNIYIKAAHNGKNIRSLTVDDKNFHNTNMNDSVNHYYKASNSESIELTKGSRVVLY